MSNGDPHTTTTETELIGEEMFTNWKSATYAFVISLVASASLVTASAGTLPAETWRTTVNHNASILQKGAYTESLTTTNRVLAEMIKYLGAGKTEDEMLATVLTHKALANAGLGNINDAPWYWNIAQAISPAAAKSDLSTFGAPGEFLERHLFSGAEPTPGGKVLPARILKQVVPQFPTGASRFGVAGDLVVQIVIDRDGQPTLPRIIHPLPAPTLSLVALDALKRWQFSPATRNGQPVPSSFDLVVHYKL